MFAGQRKQLSPCVSLFICAHRPVRLVAKSVRQSGVVVFPTVEQVVAVDVVYRLRNMSALSKKNRSGLTHLDLLRLLRPKLESFVV